MAQIEAKKSLEINAVLNIIKQCCAILFPLISFPYISRTLGSEGFGAYNFSWSFVSYFVMLAGLGISTYSVREGARIRDDRKQLERFVSEVFTINVLSSISALLLLFSIVYFNTTMKQYTSYIAIESSAIVLSLLGRDWINSIYEDFLYITIRYIVVYIIALGAMFVFIKNSSDVWIYCILAIFASFGGNIPNMMYTRRYAKFKITRKIQLKKHMPPLLTLFANTLAMMVFVNADIIMLGFYFNDEVVGIYSLSAKVYSIIKQMLNAIVIVALPRVTNIIANDTDAYVHLLKKLLNYLAIILIPVSVGLYMLSDSVILLAGGRQYIDGNVAMKILAISVIFAMMGSFLMNCVLIANREDSKCFKSTLIAAISNIVLNFIILKRVGIIGAAVTTLFAEFINAGIMTYYSKIIIKDSIIDIKNLVQCCVGSVVVALVCFVSNAGITNIALRAVCAITISIALYVLFMSFVKNEYFMEFLAPIKKRWERR